MKKKLSTVKEQGTQTEHMDSSFCSGVETLWQPLLSSSWQRLFCVPYQPLHELDLKFSTCKTSYKRVHMSKPRTRQDIHFQ